MSGLGLFRVSKDEKTLMYHEYAWNKGVGFSYSNKSSDYATGDEETALDTYTFLVNWLERFAEYKTRHLYIAGENYAAHYAPQFAGLVLHNNKITSQTMINLKGIAIGNAYVDVETYIKGQIEYSWSHSLISDETCQALVSNCRLSAEGTLSEVCKAYGRLSDKEIGHIDYSDIYAPLCSSTSNISWMTGYDPCAHNYALSYLNNPEVQNPLHANSTGIPGRWTDCSQVITSWTTPRSVLPTSKKLMASGISIWMYSGDTDGEVPVTSTRYAINKLGVSVKTSWSPWYSNGEIGGYVVDYENLTFVTVRGAGQMVASYQPARALALISSFLDAKLPTSNKK